MCKFCIVSTVESSESMILLEKDELVQENHTKIDPLNICCVKNIFKVFQVTKFIKDMVKNFILVDASRIGNTGFCNIDKKRMYLNINFNINKKFISIDISLYKSVCQ
jgi:hypothetical protein